jgi:hypothetical protein
MLLLPWPVDGAAGQRREGHTGASAIGWGWHRRLAGAAGAWTVRDAAGARTGPVAAVLAPCSTTKLLNQGVRAGARTGQGRSERGLSEDGGRRLARMMTEEIEDFLMGPTCKNVRLTETGPRPQEESPPRPTLSSDRPRRRGYIIVLPLANSSYGGTRPASHPGSPR